MSLQTLFCLLLFMLIKLTVLSAVIPPFFYVIIPSYNNEQYCINNLQSIAAQDYPHWKAIYINDDSSDQTGRLIQQYVQQNNLQHKFKIVNNLRRQGMLANIYRAVKKAKPNWIIATVDGDDTLRDNTVLSYLASIYQKKKIWMTYGSWESNPLGARVSNCAPFPSRVIKKRKFRSYKYVSSQLRTFYAALFQRIKKRYLCYKGDFFMAAGDVAFIMPLLEMSSKRHIHYVRKILYNYNVINPLNDFRQNAALQGQCSSLIRKKKPYKPLKKAFWR